MQHIIAYVVGGAAVLLMGGFAYQVFGARRDRRRFRAPGKHVEIGEHRLHVRDTGEGSPTIVLESGLMSTVLAWHALQPELAKSTRVVSYDRAGLGWSDLGPEPRDADRIVGELRALLRRSEIPPPYVLVGHSFGGLTMHLFASRYAEETAGVVLIDPVAAAEWNPPPERDQRRVEIGSKICRRAATLAHTGLIRAAAALVQSGAKAFAGRLIKTISKGAPSDSNSTDSPWFWNLPASERAMAPVFWVQPKFCRAIASQLERLPASAAQVVAAGPIDRPLTVISAANVSAQRLAAHRAIAAQSPQGRHVVAERSGHWVTEDQPLLVLEAILEIVERTRRPAELKTRHAHQS
ncbi:MAG TPA: alpha/beta hydrolase [Verrucomicrobiae bacterium]|nr:alpha/beta hydrolase [Verrucomicrobiae bacterium]